MAASFTRLLADVRAGDSAAAAQVFPIAYGELRRVAGALLKNQRPGHTLQPTALVHEAYLKLLGQEAGTWESRAHFFSIAARVMRQILVDHARHHCAGKRGGGKAALPLDEAIAYSTERAGALVDLDEALDALAAFDARKAQVIEMRFFAGMSAEEIASALAVSAPTVNRDLRSAQAWLGAHLTNRAAHA